MAAARSLGPASTGSARCYPQIFESEHSTPRNSPYIVCAFACCTRHIALPAISGDKDRGSHMTWTEERVSELTRLWSTGLSASEIGKILGVSKNSVVGKAHRMKLESRPSPIKRSPDGQPRRNRVSRSRRIPMSDAPLQGATTASRPTIAPPPGMAARAGDLDPVASEVLRRSTRAVSRKAAGGRSSACLWPIGDPGDPDFHFCGAPTVPGKPYCASHCAKAYIVKNRSDSEAA